MSNDITWAELGGDAYNLATRACLEAMSVFIQIPWFLFPTKTFTSTVKGTWKMLFTVCGSAVSTLIAYAHTAGTSVMDGIKMVPFITQLLPDEASKAFKQANTTTDNTYTFDVEAEKAKREVNQQIANLAEETVTGTGNWMQVFLQIFPIPKIVSIVWSFLIFITTVCGCNMRKTEKQEVLTIPLPKEEGTKQVKQEKKTTRRGRAKSPRR
jgi:hypothetical protein